MPELTFVLTTRGSSTVLVHRAGCADLDKPATRRIENNRWTITAASQQEAVEDYAADFMAENPDWTWEMYAQDVRFFPCTEPLPYHTPTGPKEAPMSTTTTPASNQFARLDAALRPLGVYAQDVYEAAAGIGHQRHTCTVVRAA